MPLYNFFSHTKEVINVSYRVRIHSVFNVFTHYVFVNTSRKHPNRSNTTPAILSRHSFIKPSQGVYYYFAIHGHMGSKYTFGKHSYR